MFFTTVTQKNAAVISKSITSAFL